MVEGAGRICGCGWPKGPGVTLVEVCVIAGGPGVGQLHFSGSGCCAKANTVEIRTSDIDFAKRRGTLIISPPGAFRYRPQDPFSDYGCELPTDHFRRGGK